MSSQGSLNKPFIYYDDLTPQSRSVLMLIELLNVDVELHQLNLLKNEQQQDEFKKINPAKTVPTLVFDDIVLTDSHTILIYLVDNINLDNKLLPKCYRYRLDVINKLFFESNVLNRRYSEFVTDVVRKKFENVDLNFHMNKILEAYEMMETFLQKSIFIASDVPTIADISIVATIGALDLMFPIELDTLPNLYNWLRNMERMPSYKACKVGLEKQRNLLEKGGNFRFASKVLRKSNALSSIKEEAPNECQAQVKYMRTCASEKQENAVVLGDKGRYYDSDESCLDGTKKESKSFKLLGWIRSSKSLQNSCTESSSMDSLRNAECKIRHLAEHVSNSARSNETQRKSNHRGSDDFLNIISSLKDTDDKENPKSPNIKIESGGANNLNKHEDAVRTSSKATGRATKVKKSVGECRESLLGLKQAQQQCNNERVPSLQSKRLHCKGSEDRKDNRDNDSTQTTLTPGVPDSNLRRMSSKYNRCLAPNKSKQGIFMNMALKRDSSHMQQNKSTKRVHTKFVFREQPISSEKKKLQQKPDAPEELYRIQSIQRLKPLAKPIGHKVKITPNLDEIFQNFSV